MANGGSHLPPKNTKRSAASSGRHSPSSRRSAPANSAPAAAEPEDAARRPAAGRTVHRKKSRRPGLFPLWPVALVLAAVMIFAAWKLIDILVGYKRDRAAYDALRDIAIVRLTPAPSPAADNDSPDPGELRTEPQPSEIPIAVDWEALQAVNSDIIGWLYCPDTVINYPVVQTTNNETYLDTRFEGGYSVAGTLFADADSVVGIRQSHLIVYGHNMKDKSMFGSLKNFADPDYYAQHPVLYLLTPEQCYRIDLLACQTIPAQKANYPTYFSTDEDYASYLDRMTASAYWVNAEAADTAYQLVTLSTCTSSESQRLILQGILVPIE